MTLFPIPLQAWFVYRFHQVAELHAYSTVERALKLRLGYAPNAPRQTLGPLLQEARSLGLLTGISPPLVLERDTSGERERGGAVAAYQEAICKALPRLRNTLAHGSTMLAPSSAATLSVCCDLINRLFATEGGRGT